jgi:hypothetical protein
MADQIPVATKPVDYAALVRKQWGVEYNKPEEVYEFSNNRKFEDSGSNGGVYNPS